MTDKHDFFNFVDIRKLNEISNRIGTLHLTRINDISQAVERAVDNEPTIPTEEELVSSSYYSASTAQDSKNELNQLFGLGLPPAVASVVQKYLLSTLLDNPEYKDIITRLSVLIRLEHSDEIARLQQTLDGRIAQAEKDLIKVRNRNKTRRAEIENTFKGQSRVLKEANDLMVVRKNKMIRSMNKALSLACRPNNLSEYDFEVYKIMKKYDLVGHDGSIWCCKETAIHDMEIHDFVDFTGELLKYAKSKSHFG